MTNKPKTKQKAHDIASRHTSDLNHYHEHLASRKRTAKEESRQLVTEKWHLRSN
jgi:hypothetical protein